MLNEYHNNGISVAKIHVTLAFTPFVSRIEMFHTTYFKVGLQELKIHFDAIQCPHRNH